jgi:chemotaxis protein CheY-P-specific phosphatase CheC
MIDLSPDAKDCIGKNLNIGIGCTASDLSEFVGREILMGIPHVDTLPPSGANAKARDRLYIKAG